MKFIPTQFFVVFTTIIISIIYGEGSKNGRKDGGNDDSFLRNSSETNDRHWIENGYVDSNGNSFGGNAYGSRGGDTYGGDFSGRDFRNYYTGNWVGVDEWIGTQNGYVDSNGNAFGGNAYGSREGGAHEGDFYSGQMGESVYYNDFRNVGDNWSEWNSNDWYSDDTDEYWYTQRADFTNRYPRSDNNYSYGGVSYDEGVATGAISLNSGPAFSGIFTNDENDTRVGLGGVPYDQDYNLQGYLNPITQQHDTRIIDWNSFQLWGNPSYFMALIKQFARYHLSDDEYRSIQHLLTVGYQDLEQIGSPYAEVYAKNFQLINFIIENRNLMQKLATIYGSMGNEYENISFSEFLDGIEYGNH